MSGAGFNLRCALHGIQPPFKVRPTSRDPAAQHQAPRAFQTRRFLGEGARGAPCRRRRRAWRADSFPRPIPVAETPSHTLAAAASSLQLKILSGFTHKMLTPGAGPRQARPGAWRASLRDSFRVKPRPEPGPDYPSFFLSFVAILPISKFARHGLPKLSFRRHFSDPLRGEPEETSVLTSVLRG